MGGSRGLAHPDKSGAAALFYSVARSEGHMIAGLRATGRLAGRAMRGSLIAGSPVLGCLRPQEGFPPPAAFASETGMPGARAQVSLPPSGPAAGVALLPLLSAGQGERFACCESGLPAACRA